VTKADTFKYAVSVFSREMARLAMPPTNDQIVRLSIATDAGVQFSIDQSESVTFIFSDGSRAIVHPY
jgi:hypothetical protein